MASPSKSREEAATSESSSSCKNIRHWAAPCGPSPSRNTAPSTLELLLAAFPEASCSLFLQLFLQGHRRRVGGEGRQRRGHVGCSARIQEFGGKGTSLAKGPVCAGVV